uniref:Fucosyltransferase n=1 Tax=Scleropages formosus TaxID=113540 RepID=A0A8C9SQQ8_SCLFO
MYLNGKLETNGNWTLTTILLWFYVFGKHVDLGDCSSLFGIDGHSITEERALYDVADGVLIHHRDIKRDLSNTPQAPHPSLQKWVWMNFESPSNAPRIDTIKDLFNLTTNYRRDADIAMHESLVVTDKPKLFQVLKKSLLVCWIVRGWNPGHQRVKYYTELKQHIDISVFVGHFRPLSNEEYITTMVSCKFYLSFESSSHVDYITEKLYKWLLLGAVPVVLGIPRERCENIALICMPVSHSYWKSIFIPNTLLNINIPESNMP